MSDNRAELEALAGEYLDVERRAVATLDDLAPQLDEALSALDRLLARGADMEPKARFEWELMRPDLAAGIDAVRQLRDRIGDVPARP